jgi:hypothetical protein
MLLASVAGAQQKPISLTYQRDILDARTIAVVGYSSGQLGSQAAQENQRASLDVQNALQKWGKYQVTADTDHADLIVVVRKGHAQAATIGGGGPVVFDPGDAGASIGVHRGQNQPLSRTESSQPISRAPMGAEAGSPDDRMEIYHGRQPLEGDGSRNATQYPMDETPMWSYTATDALQPPKLEAVVQFRKAVEAAEKKKP